MVTSDSKGEFVFSSVPAIPMFLSASLDGYTTAMTLANPGPSHGVSDDASRISLRLVALVSISGVVRGADGAPFANAQVLLLWCHSEGGWLMRTLTDAIRTGADGSYVFPHRTPGWYELIASVPHGFQPPGRDQQGHFVGYVPVRYPKPSPDAPRSFLEFTDGQPAAADFRTPRGRTASYRWNHECAGDRKCRRFPTAPTTISAGRQGLSCADLRRGLPTGASGSRPTSQAATAHLWTSLPVEVRECRY